MKLINFVFILIKQINLVIIILKIITFFYWSEREKVNEPLLTKFYS